MSNLVELRAEDMVTMYDHSFTKKQATQTGEALVNDLFERGEVDPLKVFSNIVRLKQVIDTAEKAFRERIDLKGVETWNGVTFTPKNGGEKLNYSNDPIYADLESKLKDRAELIKVATKCKNLIYDEEGCEVPKVSSTFSKSSITVNF